MIELATLTSIYLKQADRMLCVFLRLTCMAALVCVVGCSAKKVVGDLDSVFRLSWDTVAKKIVYSPYAQTSDTGDGYFASGERYGQFYVDGNLFLIEEYGCIVAFETADEQPRVVADSSIRTIFRGDTHLFSTTIKNES